MLLPWFGCMHKVGLRRMVMYITAALPNHLSPAFALCSCATVLLVVGRRERHAWLDDWLLGCSPAGPEWRWSRSKALELLLRPPPPNWGCLLLVLMSPLPLHSPAPFSMWRCHVHPLGYAPKPHAPPTPPVVVLRMRIVPPGQSKESSPSSGSWVYDETLPAATGLFLPYGSMSTTTEGHHRRRWPQIAALAKVIGILLASPQTMLFPICWFYLTCGWAG